MVKVAVVTDSNKGIAFGILQVVLKRFTGVVYLTSKDESKGKVALAELHELGLHPEYYQMDVTDRHSVSRFGDHIVQKHGGIDLLVNNAEDDNVVSCAEELLFPLVWKHGVILNITGQCAELSNLRLSYWVEALPKTHLTEDSINELVGWFTEGLSDGSFNFVEVTDDETVITYTVGQVLANVSSNEFEYAFGYGATFKYADSEPNTEKREPAPQQRPCCSCVVL